MTDDDLFEEIRLALLHPALLRIDLVQKLDDLRARIDRKMMAAEKAENEARIYAGHYKDGSDGRNTFVMLADRIAEFAKGR